MKRLTVAPGLTLDEALFEAAAEGVAAHAPELGALSWEQFTAPSGWTLVPDEETGRAYKAELTLQEHPHLLRRINVWFEADLRGNAAPRPHSHPWPFTAHVLLGGYDEERYVRKGYEIIQGAASHRAGRANVLHRELFHEVTEIHEPGRTLTLMVADAPGVRGGWGYLSPDTGAYIAAPPPSEAFLAALRELNPHRP
ncbi:hypothetical protein ABT340_35720 [Streptosporangium sp. NPDC000239]|uniref:hypothetical protein n=1 Tax=Streptosporangium sp. NPDC000239 TaxID=3154248 RepID=UPI00331BD6B1